MKKRKIIPQTIALAAFLILPLFSTAQSYFRDSTLSEIAAMEGKSFSLFSGRSQESYSTNYDVKYYRCMWEVDPAVRYISGNVTTIFKITEPLADSVVFDLAEVMTVDSVRYHLHQIAWNHGGGLVSVLFPGQIPQNTIDSVTIYYHGVPPETGFGSFGHGTHNGAPVIWTLSEPFGASDWWPCKNGLSDKADSLDVFIRTPSGYKAASNGILASSITGSGFTFVHWKHRYPIATYLVCLAASNYAVFQQKIITGNDTLNVLNYVYPEDSANAVAQLQNLGSMISLFDSLFGLYPFQREKFGHCQFNVGGGMEHQTITFCSDFGFELVAHELGHQWFGDKITCGSWHDIWLNEGFATYLSGLCYEHLIPGLWTQFRRVRIQQIVSQPNGSVYCPDTTSVPRIFSSRLTYAKGGMILHQLRLILGDEAFFGALNDYINDPLLAYNFALTPDLQAHLESRYGQDLTWYFDQWYTGEGYPSYHLNWTRSNDTVYFTLQQTQSDPSVTFFALPVDIMFKGSSQDTLMWFNNTYSGQTFTAVLPFTVDSLFVDPQWQIISGNNTVNGIQEIRQITRLTIYPNPATEFITIPVGVFPVPAKYTLYNTSGQMVRQGMADRPGYRIPVGSLSEGLYMLVLEDGGHIGEARFLKTH